MSAHIPAIFIMKYTVRVILVLMCAGLTFMVFNQVYAVLPKGELFFTIALWIILFTPLLVVLVCGAFFAYKKQISMVIISLVLFAALVSGGAIYVFVL